ncbi:MAG: insulinase family protein [Oscillospiraceae bacterium]|nr:insulinase family protein [Oscillospiraceae bacterium]
MQPVRHPLAEGVNFLGITDDRFKTAQLTVALLLPLQEQTASSYAILPFLLRRNCGEYPDFSALQRRLNQLYGARILADVIRIGSNQALILTAVSIDDRFALNREAITQQCAELLRSMIFEPAFKDGHFNDDDTELEKRCLVELIQSEINDKRLYSRQRCEQILCEGEGYAVNRYGTIDGVGALTPEHVTNAWKRALQSAQVCIVYQATSCGAIADNLAKSFAAAAGRAPTPLITAEKRTIKNKREVVERLDVNQAKLVLGFKAYNSAGDDIAAMRLMNALLGGTPHSLLFKNVREKLSLCYYCSSSYDRFGRVLLIDSGVDEQNAKKAQEQIIKQYDAVCRGDFTDGDIESARTSLENQFRSIEDHQSSLATWYIGQSLDNNISTPAQAADELYSVTRDRIVNAARSISLEAVYMLAAKEGEHAGK